jgi:hypothetical protein
MEQVDACASASDHGHGQDSDLVETRVFNKVLGCGLSSGLWFFIWCRCFGLGLGLGLGLGPGLGSHYLLGFYFSQLGGFII